MFNPAARTVNVTRQLAQVRGGGFAFGPTKSRAGKRMVTIPEVILPVIQWHLACFAQEGDEGLVFTSPAGQPLHHSNFRRRVWLPALGKAGLPAVHFHDYADVRVMPTSARTSCSSGVNALKLSA